MDVGRLLVTLEKASGNATDIYYGLYTDYFENGSDPVSALKIILEYPNEIGNSEDRDPTTISNQEENRLSALLEEMITGMTDRIVEMNLTQKDFYEKLYANIFDSANELFPQTKEERVIALKILSENVSAVPYFQVLEVDKITKEEFVSGIDRLVNHILEANHMLQRQFATTPEEAAQILRIADEITDKKDRIIYWTVLLNTLRRQNE